MCSVGCFEKLGPVYEVVSMVNVRARLDWAEQILHSLAMCFRIPEPISVTKLIAQGITEKSM